MEYYAAMRINELTAVWTNLTNMILNEKSQTQKTAYCMISYFQNRKN